jgi:hypothetical protein
VVWTIDLESEANVILPWVLSNPPRSDREAVAAWFTMVWTIDPEVRVVFVAVLR